jgi:hypothetical protein
MDTRKMGVTEIYMTSGCSQWMEYIEAINLQTLARMDYCLTKTWDGKTVVLNVGEYMVKARQVDITIEDGNIVKVEAW